MSMLKGLMLKNVIIGNYHAIINRKNFCDWASVSDIKRYKEIRKSTNGQGEDYTNGCLFDYDYVKNYYRLMAIDLSRQKESDAYPKTIQQIEFAGELKNKKLMVMLQMQEIWSV